MEYGFEIGTDQRYALGCYQIIYNVRRVVIVHSGDISHDGRLIGIFTHTPIALVRIFNLYTNLNFLTTFLKNFSVIIIFISHNNYHHSHFSSSQIFDYHYQTCYIYRFILYAVHTDI